MGLIKTGALNDKNLAIYPGDVAVGDNIATAEDLGAIENLKFEAGAESTTRDFDNREKVITKIKTAAKITFDWGEFENLRLVANLFKGVYELVELTATSTTADTETLTLSKTAGSPVRYKNAAGTAVTPVVKTLAGVTLSVTTAYTVSVVNGYTMITLATGYATETETVTVDYSYTPKASLRLKPTQSGVAQKRAGKVTVPVMKENGSTVYKEVAFYSATASSPLMRSFVNTDRTNDVGVMPVTLDLGKDWEFTDEFNV